MKMSTKLVSIILTLGMLITAAWAVGSNYPSLDKVKYTVTAEQWVNTSSAKVTVSVNAALTDKQLGTIQTAILNNLKTISNQAQWHITEFNRSKNQAGLEQLSALAVARIPAAELSTLRENAKRASKPGATYTITNINFTPSVEEIQKAKADLRAKIYAQVKDELARLNDQYTKEQYFLHTIIFNSQDSMPTPQVRTMILTKVEGKESQSMAVSNKVTLNASVVLASKFNLK